MSKRLFAVFADNVEECFVGVSMREWVPQMNHRLGRTKALTRVVEWFANTGNLVVTTSLKNTREVARAFASATELPCVAVTLSEFYWCLGKVRELEQPPGQPESRWTPGAAFRVKGRKRYFEPFSSPRGEFQCLSTDVVGVQKRDVITAAGARRQKWRLLSVDVAERLGGQWIARSLHSLDGTLVRALMYVGR